VSTLIATPESPVKSAVQSAWRRRLMVLSVEELGLALSVVFAGAILMLLLGTQILEWYWLLPLAIAGLTIGAVRVRRRVVDRYEVAQLLDETLALNDSLSTAWFLLTSETRFDPGAAECQIRSAEALAETVQAAHAFPLVRRRSWTVAGAMGCALLGLFAIRYLVTQSLSLRAPFVSVRLGAANDRVAQELVKKSPARSGLRNQELLPPEFRNSEAESRNENSKREARPGQDLKGGTGDQNGGSKAEGVSDPESASESASPDERQSPAADSSRQGQQAGQNNSDEKSPGLLDKMKDALSGVVAKMRQSSSSQNKSQEGRNSSSQEKRQQPSAGAKDETGQSPDAQQQKMDPTSEGQAQSQTAEKTSRVGANSDQGPQGKSSDSQSGAGRQDGQKRLSEAEQLKAMGRLAEIIGKRSASVTGEMTVEKSSKQQQLQTQYSQRMGHHADRGGEINHDEIPFEYRGYIQEYMTQIHKQAQTKH
jgi:hypothetical protein